MSWGTVEVEPEVEHWLLWLPSASATHVAHYIDLLEEEGARLGEPYTRQLRGKLRELRFSIEGRPIRVTYFIRSGRRIVLLTVFGKRRRRERGEFRERCARWPAVWRRITMRRRARSDAHEVVDDQGEAREGARFRPGV